MKKIRTVVFLCASLCALFLTLVSCRSNDEPPGVEQSNSTSSLKYAVAFADVYDKTTIPFEIAYQSENDYLQNEDVIAIIKNEDELLSLCREKRFPFFDEKDLNFDRKLSRTMRSFDDEYFENNDLIFVLLSGIGSYLSKIDRIAIEQDVLTVYISNPVTDNDVSEPINTFVGVVGMKKTLLENVSDTSIKKVEKGMINEYEQINAYSEFYSLEYAYNRRMITKDDVRSIGYYNNSGKEWRGTDDSEEIKDWKDFVETDYRPLKEIPEELPTNTIEKIKTAYVDLINSSLQYFYQKEGISIRKDLVTEQDIYEVKYFGEYNGYLAVAVKSSSMSLQQVTTPKIAGTVFYYSNSADVILLFRDGK